MFEAETKAFLESGCALVVATVTADGEPHATRGWRLTVPDPGRRRVELVLDADDAVAASDLDATGAVAITGADVRTLRSVQLKGRAVERRPAVERDHALIREFCDEFFGAVEETDGTPRVLLERLVPSAFVVQVVEVDEVYDQTPGPSAGSALPPAS